MGAIAPMVFYSNYMVAPLIPASSREFAVLPDALGWLVPGFSIAYGVSTLMYVALSDRFGNSSCDLLSLFGNRPFIRRIEHGRCFGVIVPIVCLLASGVAASRRH
jgi:MFS family permease